MDTTTPGSGHNRGPVMNSDELALYLMGEYIDMVKRRDELLAGAERMPEITDDVTAGKAGDFSVEQIGAHLKALEATRVKEKEPFLSGGRVVDGWFHKIAKPLQDGKAKIDARRKAYLDAKADAERKRREAEARRLAEEAAKREAEMKTPDALDEAIEAHGAAAEAAKAAAAKTAELSRVRGDHGTVSSLEEFWTFRDLDRAKIDLEELRQHIPIDALERAVRSFIRAGGRTIKGAFIYKDTRL